MVTINMKDGRCAYPKSSCTKVREQLAQQKALLDEAIDIIKFSIDMGSLQLPEMEKAYYLQGARAFLERVKK